MIVTGDAVRRFATVMLGRPLLEPNEAIGVERDGSVVAAMVFDHYDGPDIHVTVASAGELPRSLIRAAGRYVFDQLRCQRATLITEQPKVVDYGRRLGAVGEGILRDKYGPMRPGYQMAFFKDAWRF